MRVLVALYALFALAAGARSGVQLATRAAEAPAAYGLSALAALLYLAAAIALHRGARRAARAILAVELAGVVLVGIASLALPSAFPDATVWSAFGQGYGFLPLVLPLTGLAVLARSAVPVLPPRLPGGLEGAEDADDDVLRAPEGGPAGRAGRRVAGGPRAHVPPPRMTHEG